MFDLRISKQKQKKNMIIGTKGYNTQKQKKMREQMEMMSCHQIQTNVYYLLDFY